MRIVNFRKHPEEKAVGFKGSRKELATFDLEFTSLECVITWTGWSIRRLQDQTLALQAPLKCFASTESREPVVKIDKIPASLFLRLLRHQIKAKYEIEIPEPTPRPKKKQEKKPCSTPSPSP